MSGIREVIKYSNLDYYNVLKLPLDTFMMMRKNAFIEQCMRTEEGQKYLKDCKRFEQTEPDYDAIKRFQDRHKK
ncbi:hypothetical protein SAMN02745134_00250 [Clostridium acidisoli DSM 12555]|uniref:Uncharacterized protein n=1 Tax=Clostridium acidisoli DSM 12555 TaxID=1121291 RepID=A0A1W1X0E5_9CLOT|nr:hypothetical protein [Clostridium acidisoli]SMC17188.1 hypothetical protein SAMN02745134_00250 [Clostridium acidisoli DSM 12555]